MLDIHPLQVTCLSRGTFDRYYDEKQSQGLPLTERRPLRMKASDSSVGDLLRVSTADPGGVEVRAGSEAREP